MPVMVLGSVRRSIVALPATISMAQALADASQAGVTGDADAVARDEAEEACHGPSNVTLLGHGAASHDGGQAVREKDTGLRQTIMPAKADDDTGTAKANTGEG